jgi:hypothetical protein
VTLLPVTVVASPSTSGNAMVETGEREKATDRAFDAAPADGLPLDVCALDVP